MVIRFNQPVFGREFNSRDQVGIALDDLRSPSLRSTSFPAVDVVENEQGFELVAEVPGLKKEDVKIAVERRTLTLSGERKHYGFPDGTKIIRHETQTDPFSRAFELPEEVDGNQISAELTNGILRVRLPRVEKTQRRDISIK